MGPDDVDYAVPAAVRSSRARERRRPDGPAGLWGGRPRRLLLVGCWLVAALLALPLLLPLLAPDRQGAASPEAAVEQLLSGIADVDPVAIVATIDPDEVRDPDRARAAYDRMGGRLLRRGEVPPADVTAMLATVEGQLDGGDLASVASLAALDLDLQGLRLEAAPPDGGGTPVYVRDGVLDVALDPARLPDDASGLGRASYTMPLAEGWRVDRAREVEPFLVTVERDGRWYVSLEASADAILDPAR